MNLTKPQKKQLIHALRIAVDYETDYVNSLKIDGKLIRSGKSRGDGSNIGDLICIMALIPPQYV